MKVRIASHRVRSTLAAVLLAGLAGCSTAPPPPAAAKPITFAPPRPRPPQGASPSLAVPPVGIDGIRRTVNTSISPAQTAWNLRAAYNVAALNCLQPQHAQILDGYKTFLNEHKRTLARINRTVDAEFRGKYGAQFIPPREAYMTQVYNYFAFPPTLTAFCDATLAIGLEAQAVKSADLEAFAAVSLPRIDAVFEDFYRSYEQYRAELAAWEAIYAPPLPAVAPAPAVPVTATAPRSDAIIVPQPLAQINAAAPAMPQS